MIRSLWLAFILAASTLSPAAPQDESGRRAFERLQSLAGSWAGPAVWDEGGQKGSVDFEVSYQVTSG